MWENQWEKLDFSRSLLNGVISSCVNFFLCAVLFSFGTLCVIFCLVFFFPQSYMWLLTKWGWECARLLSSQNSPAGPARPGPSESTPRWRSAQVKARVFCPASRSSSMEVPSRWASSSLSLSSVMGSLSLAVPDLYSTALFLVLMIVAQNVL